MKTFKAIVTLPSRNFVFIHNKRVYGGEVIDVTEAQFSLKTMKRVRQAQKAKEVVEPPVKQGSGLL